MFSRLSGHLFLNLLVDVPRKLRHAPRMDQAGKDRARAYVLRAMSAAGVASPQQLAERADVDPGTVRTFLDGHRYPQAAKRQAIEEALGLQPNAIHLAALGVSSDEPAGDPVEEAIEASQLTRGNKKRLIGTYYDMLDSQQERGAS